MSCKKKPWWCVVCGSDEDDEIKYGPLRETRKFNVHFFCLLLSGTFEQRGRDTDGVYGFLLRDIESGLELIKDTKCWYCGYNNASIYCAHKGCRRVFHLTCGVASGCLSQFMGSFESYCHRHNDEFKYRHYGDETCVICRDPLKFTCDAVTNDCCNGVFHRRCLGSLALSAGYFFKCPLCNNTDQFRKCMRQKGIFVPDRDASWELENNAFNDLYTPSYSCEAPRCLSKQGRKFNSVNGFAFLSCSSCGAGSIHQKCCGGSDYICPICTSLYKRSTGEEGDAADNNPEATLKHGDPEDTFSHSVIQNLINAERETDQQQVSNFDSPLPHNTPSVERRRSMRHTIQRQALHTPDAGSPFKTRSIRASVGGTPKRRRLI